MSIILNSTVQWTSSAAGTTKTKIGVVVGVISPGDAPMKSWKLKSPGKPRNHESYIVQVGNQNYWPRVNALEVVVVSEEVYQAIAPRPLPVPEPPPPIEVVPQPLPVVVEPPPPPIADSPEVAEAVELMANHGVTVDRTVIDSLIEETETKEEKRLRKKREASARCRAKKKAREQACEEKKV